MEPIILQMAKGRLVAFSGMIKVIPSCTMGNKLSLIQPTMPSSWLFNKVFSLLQLFGGPIQLISFSNPTLQRRFYGYLYRPKHLITSKTLLERFLSNSSVIFDGRSIISGVRVTKPHTPQPARASLILIFWIIYNFFLLYIFLYLGLCPTILIKSLFKKNIQ